MNRAGFGRLSALANSAKPKPSIAGCLACGQHVSKLRRASNRVKISWPLELSIPKSSNVLGLEYSRLSCSQKLRAHITAVARQRRRDRIVRKVKSRLRRIERTR